MSLNAYMRAADQLGPLDEAYHGRNKIKPIQDAMDAIYKKVSLDPKFKVQGSKENKNLQKAIVQAFGFQRCSIYWRYQDISLSATYVTPAFDVKNPISGEKVYIDPTVRNPNPGPYTVPAAVYIPVAVEKARKDVNGDNYDTNHTMACFVTMDQNFVQHGLTSEELVAMLLHEIGHNFDATIFKTISTWMPWLDMLINFINICNTYNISPQQAWNEVGQYVKSGAKSIVGSQIISKVAPELVGIYYNMEDIILSAITPLAKKLKPLIAVGSKIWNTIMAVLIPASGIIRLPAHIMTMPLQYIGSTLGRKSETYADSFAAQYGYGAELGSALGKTDKLIMANGYGADNKYLAPIYDIGMVYQSFMCMVDSHENTPERYQRAIRTLERDLKESELSPEDKKLIQEELKRVQKSYDQYVKLSDDDKHVVYAAYTKLVNAWIKSDVYDAFTKLTLLPSQTYAQ